MFESPATIPHCNLAFHLSIWFQIGIQNASTASDMRQIAPACKYDFAWLLAGQAWGIDYSKTMFVRRLSIQRIDSLGAPHACPLHWIDSFAMRNFTNDALFDDTLPVADGLLEAGCRVPLDRLQPAMEDWFRRKGYLKPEERLVISVNR